MLVALPSLESGVEGVVDAEEEEAKEVLVDVLLSLAVQRLLMLGAGGVIASWCSSSSSSSEPVMSASSCALREVYSRVEETLLNEPSPRPRSVTDEDGRASLSRVVSRALSLADSLR